MSKKKYDVHRSMTGDRDYSRGDVREMEEADAADLVASGALSLEGKPPAVRDPAVQHGPIPKKDRSFGHKVEKPPREPSVKIDDKRAGTSVAPQDRQDGPTVKEYVASGYPAAQYPPSGYASRSTADEIASAIAAQATAGDAGSVGAAG